MAVLPHLAFRAQLGLAVGVGAVRPQITRRRDVRTAGHIGTSGNAHVVYARGLLATGPAGAATAVVPALFARTIGGTGRNTDILVVADIAIFAVTAVHTTTIRTALFATAVGGALARALPIDAAEHPHRAVAAVAAAAVRAARLA